MKTQFHFIFFFYKIFCNHNKDPKIGLHVLCTMRGCYLICPLSSVFEIVLDISRPSIWQVTDKAEQIADRNQVLYILLSDVLREKELQTSLWCIVQ